MNILGESFLKDHHHLLRQEKAAKIIFAALQKVPSNHSHTQRPVSLSHAYGPGAQPCVHRMADARIPRKSGCKSTSTHQHTHTCQTHPQTHTHTHTHSNTLYLFQRSQLPDSCGLRFHTRVRRVCEGTWVDVV